MVTLLNDIPKDIYSPEFFEYIKGLSEKMGYECHTDKANNIIIHRIGRGDKVLVPFLIEREEVLITSVSGNKAEFVANTDIKIDDKTKVYMYGKLIGYTSDKCIELLDGIRVKKGEKGYINNEVNCKADKLYGRNLKSNISLYIVNYLIKEVINSDKDLYFTLSFSKKSAKTLSEAIKPNYIYSLSYDDIGDNFKLSMGCGIVYKDGGAVINRNIVDLYLNCSKEIPHQVYFGKSSSLSEYYLISVKGVKVGSLVIPIKKINTACEIASVEDIDSALLIYKNLLQNEV